MSSITDLPRPPVHGFRGDTPTPPPLSHPSGLSVAISREAGARGATIARKVGELVGWQVFDQESLDYLVQDDTARQQLQLVVVVGVTVRDVGAPAPWRDPCDLSCVTSQSVWYNFGVGSPWIRVVSSYTIISGS